MIYKTTRKKQSNTKLQMGSIEPMNIKSMIKRAISLPDTTRNNMKTNNNIHPLTQGLSGGQG